MNWINANESTAPQAVNTALAATTGGKALKANVLALAWTHLTFTLDPVRRRPADRTRTTPGRSTFNSTSNIKGILDLGPLNAILTAAGDPTVSAGSLG